MLALVGIGIGDGVGWDWKSGGALPTGVLAWGRYLLLGVSAPCTVPVASHVREKSEVLKDRS